MNVIRKTVVLRDTPTNTVTYEKKKVIFKSYQIIWYVVGLLEILLGFRFVLRVVGANPYSIFASFIYNLSYPFVFPFQGILATPYSGGNVVEWFTLIAMVVYLVLAYILIEFLQLIKPVSQDEVEQGTEE
ncbi:MAG TPA: hypothetical protein VEW42_00990 [Candidatus Eisenbacteria bacterium]|nr:hypothetical protein [Candidatus Eisenbacteria bacterium]